MLNVVKLNACRHLRKGGSANAQAAYLTAQFLLVSGEISDMPVLS